MHTGQLNTSSRLARPEGPAIGLPSWVPDLLGTSTLTSTSTSSLYRGTNYSLLSLTHPHAATLSLQDFQSAAASLYRQAQITLRNTKHPHLIRIWNFIPEIHRRFDEGLDRYRVFNLGRYQACAEWFGADSFAQALPTATGVGHQSHDLTIHFLSSSHPGIPLENPRQCSAFEYSKRLGPRPPCFARATLCNDFLTIGGTASVRGEDSVHLGSLQRQLDETFQNLSAVLIAAESRSSPYHITHARIYAPALLDHVISQPSHHLIRGHFGPHCLLEYVRADICREELLVEIEAFALPLARGTA